MKIWFAVFAALILATVPKLTRAEDAPTATGTPDAKAKLPILYVADAKGDVKVYVHNEKGEVKKKKPSIPEPLGVADRIVTGKDGHAFLQFREGGTVEVGPKSDVQVSELEEGKDFKAKFNLAFGRLKSIVRKLTTPSSKYEVESGGVVAGVRGTQFEVVADPDTKQVRANTYEGTIFTSSDGVVQNVAKGFSLTVGAGGKGVMGQLAPNDVADFVTFVALSGDLEKQKKFLLDKLEKKLLNKLTKGILDKAEDGTHSIHFGF